MMTTTLKLLMCVMMCGATATGFAAGAGAETTAPLPAQGAVGPADSAPFRMADDGTVFIPGWDDDRASSRPEELAQVTADEFAQPAAHVYRGELIMKVAGNETPTLAFPANTGTIAFYARSIPWHGIHPRVRMTARPTDGSPARVLWEGQVASLTRARYTAPLPAELRGKQAVLSFEFVTPKATAQRIGFYLRRIVMEK